MPGFDTLMLNCLFPQLLARAAIRDDSIFSPGHGPHKACRNVHQCSGSFPDEPSPVVITVRVRLRTLTHPGHARLCTLGCGSHAHLCTLRAVQLEQAVGYCPWELLERVFLRKNICCWWYLCLRALTIRQKLTPESILGQHFVGSWQKGVQGVQGVQATLVIDGGTISDLGSASGFFCTAALVGQGSEHAQPPPLRCHTSRHHHRTQPAPKGLSGQNKICVRVRTVGHKEAAHLRTLTAHYSACLCTLKLDPCARL